MSLDTLWKLALIRATAFVSRNVFKSVNAPNKIKMIVNVLCAPCNKDAPITPLQCPTLKSLAMLRRSH